MGISWRGPLQGEVVDGLELCASLLELGGALGVDQA
jgi:hypothetical protein